VLLFFPDYLDAYVYRARLNFNEQKFMAAIDDWTNVIRLNPRNGEGNYDRGIVYQAIGRYDDAISDFRRALELFNLFPELQDDRGRAYLQADVAARMEQIKNQP
jgi:tetratricopeptide (TPR) repeat protein